jgi:hypothetical protein
MSGPFNGRRWATLQHSNCLTLYYNGPIPRLKISLLDCLRSVLKYRFPIRNPEGMFVSLWHNLLTLNSVFLIKLRCVDKINESVAIWGEKL